MIPIEDLRLVEPLAPSASLSAAARLLNGLPSGESMRA